MQEIAVAVPDTNTIDQKASDALTRAGELEIKDEPTYRSAGAFMQAVKDLMREVEKTFDEPIEAAHRAHKLMLAAKKTHAQPLEDAERMVKFKMTKFYDEQQRKIREENARIAEEKRLADLAARKAQEEHERQVREHEAAVRAAQQKAADDARAAIAANKPVPLAAVPPPPPPPPAPVAPPVSAPVTRAPAAAGVSMRTVRKFEIVNLMELVQAVSMGLAPLSYLQANETEIGKAAKDPKIEAILGVHFYNETVAAAR